MTLKNRSLFLYANGKHAEFRYSPEGGLNLIN
jgi:hypothetical protein